MSIEMTPARWAYTGQYLDERFPDPDAHLAGLRRDATKAGLPDISISPAVGHLLKLLTGMTEGKCAVEVGTLGGYSAIWIARGLAPDGQLITIEPVTEHADFAEVQFKKAGVEHKVSLARGTGIDILSDLKTEMAVGSVDVLFFDAVKTEYPAYFDIARSLIKKGGLLIADNILGAGTWWIDSEGDESREAVISFTKQIRNDPDFESMAVPLREGVLVARRMR